MARIPFLDSLYNMITGLGTSKDPTQASTYQLNLLNRNDQENAYRGDWIARAIIDAPAEDATREWRDWQASKDQIEAIEEEEKRLDIQRKMKQAIIRARLYGGAALVMGINGQEPEEELDLESVGEGDLEFVVVMNRYELMAGQRIYNVESPWYTRPEYYTVATPLFGFEGEKGQGIPLKTPGDVQRQQTPPMGMVKLHPSRVIEFVGHELPDWRLIPMGGGWGDSVLQTVDDTLKDIGLVVGGVANMVNDAKMDVVKIPNFSKNINTKEYSQRLLQRFAYANQAKSSINTLVIDSTEEWERIQTQFGGLPNLLHEFMQFVSGGAEIPVSRLFGSSSGRAMSGGGAGTGQGADTDMRNYYDRISSAQRNDYSPRMSALDECLVRSALGSRDPSIHYLWAPLWQTSESEKATISLQKANATKLDVDMGLLNEDALRQARVNQLIEDGQYPGFEDAIDEFGSEPDEEDIQVQWSRLAGKLPAPMGMNGGGGPPKQIAPPKGGNGGSRRN